MSSAPAIAPKHIQDARDAILESCMAQGMSWGLVMRQLADLAAKGYPGAANPLTGRVWDGGYISKRIRSLRERWRKERGDKRQEDLEEEHLMMTRQLFLSALGAKEYDAAAECLDRQARLFCIERDVPSASRGDAAIEVRERLVRILASPDDDGEALGEKLRRALARPAATIIDGNGKEVAHGDEDEDDEDG